MTENAVALSFLSWRDPLAWTEEPSKFKAAAAAETRAFGTAVRAAAPAADVRRLAHAFAVADAEHRADLLWCWPPAEPVVLYKPNLEGGGGYVWTWAKGVAVGQPSWKYAADMDVFYTQGNKLRVVYTSEAATDSHAYRVVCRSPGSIAWTSDRLVGPDCAELGSRIFVLEQESPLRYTRLVSLDAETGRGRRVVHECADPEWQLRIVKGAGLTLFLMEERAGVSRCYWVGPRGVQRLASKATVIFPIGAGPSRGVPILATRATVDAPWEIHGGSVRLNEEIRGSGLEFATPEILVTRRAGNRRVWRVGPARPEFLGEFLGGILPDPILLWKPLGPLPPLRLWVVAPGTTLRCFQVGRNMLRAVIPGLPYGRVSRGTVVSMDGAEVGWVLVRPPTALQPKGLVVCAYGAYGLPTNLSTARWKPWLDAGWAIGFALVRGGGDSDDAWAAAGRLGGKEAGIDDFEAVILHLQGLTSVEPARTCIYGRSAGGLMVGGIAGRHPAGGLARLVYTEVPYVDMLKTAADATLPLTPAEYLEFGNPAAGPAEFAQTMRSSPIHRLGPEGAAGLRVVCRTGVFDIRVYPYESLKWILTLRGVSGSGSGVRAAPDEKYLAVGAEGHFSRGQSRQHYLAEDLVVLNAENRESK